MENKNVKSLGSKKYRAIEFIPTKKVILLVIIVPLNLGNAEGLSGF